MKDKVEISDRIESELLSINHNDKYILGSEKISSKIIFITQNIYEKIRY